jgi:pimeloyl-ACP methyl ester carboxylesterase
MRKSTIIIAIILSVVGVWIPGGGTASAAAPPACQEMPGIPVTLNGTSYNVAGRLCWQGELTGKTVQVLTAGISYNSAYWDWPLEPGRYSYAQAATVAGYATFAYDRLGSGDSDRPDAFSLDLPAEVNVLHQLVQGLRGGAIGGHAFNKVITVGHSYGSAISGIEANTYNDVDGVILSGITHSFTLINPVLTTASFWPAQLDPKFAAEGLPLGYLTTLPGTRANLFYHAPNADPAVVAKEEALKDTLTIGQYSSVSNYMQAASTTAVNAPVLVAMGQKDILFCDGVLLLCTNDAAVVAREARHFNEHACLEGYVLNNSGHDLNLHRNAPDWFTAANSWADRRVGTAGTSATQVCP